MTSKWVDAGAWISDWRYAEEQEVLSRGGQTLIRSNCGYPDAPASPDDLHVKYKHVKHYCRACGKDIGRMRSTLCLDCGGASEGTKREKVKP